MFKNVALKKIIKNSVFKPLYILNRIIPKDDKIILLYTSNFGVRHNLKPLLEYLIEGGYNEKYSIVCGIENLKYKGEDYINVSYVGKCKSIITFLRAKHVFYTAGQIPIKPSKNQIVIHMNHGIGYKTIGALTNINNGDEFFFTHMIASGDCYVPILAQAYRCGLNNVFVCDEPTTAAFYKPLKERYQLGNYDKILFWLPTFRASDYLGYNDSMADKLLLLFEKDNYEELNEKLKQYNYKLIVKLHSAQTLKNYQLTQLSNLYIYSDEDFIKSGYELYQMLMQIDVLIGDYSSVSLQFLLLDKPCAYVIPDIEEYGRRRGFVFDNPEAYMPGYKIKTQKEFYQFLNDLSLGSDPYEQERERVKNIIYKYCDGNACKRLLELSDIH
ncbi:MAG: CDP-glycerol glycerophosphotransferase family protein [Bacteroidales bacterium]|nr:CDP-glycerol glycerophosphotransferase family protein [Lachnoclostridium sp.]MCM1384115.1 CDP-glycerol glycerophosphotransferase family protein [Lachnoclostridium sp.]MCM1465675.1 CDP-glycerol glycerophosphotransferase family protein [Bacteroidales bacterium]